MRTLFMLAFVILGLLSSAGSQTSFSLENQNGYIGNAFSNYAALPDYYSFFTAALHHDRLGEKSGLRLYYNGSYTAFKNYSERNTHSHELGLAWYTLLGEAENRIDAGVNAGTRLHSESYQWYMQEQFQAYMAVKYIIKPHWFTYLGVTLNSLRYPELVPFSQVRSLLYARSSWFLPTGTTLITEADLMQKAYTGSASALQQAYTEVQTAGEGRSTQLLWLLRVAQGVSSRIGLSAEFQLRHNFASASRYLGNAEGYYFSDEELFEDYFAWHGHSLQLGYRHELPWDMNLTLSGRSEERIYDERLAADLLGNPFPDGRLREDVRTLFSVEWQKELRVNSAASPLTIELGWSWLKNSSNDLYYTYRSASWGMGLSYEW
jgi:hypothetical protein